jgi:hypothetical protein
MVAACGAAPALSLADKSLMPDVVLMQSEYTQEAYRFAVAHPDDLTTVPCYCGCVGIGHRDNRDCYLKPESKPDALLFDDHALACEICADITHLTMEMKASGASSSAIRTAVDSRFADRGPGTNTPFPAQALTNN